MQGGGVGAARFFAQLGYRVIATDLRDKKALTSSLKTLSAYPITFVLGEHRFADIDRASLIVKNPGIPAHSPFLEYARKHKKRITNDADLFLSLAPHERIIGVTGTKGKTTTTMLIKHLLGPSALLVGTPGVSFFDYFFARREPRWIVGEFSSFDLEYIHQGPHMSVYTSLFSDHLNRYSSFAAYARAKSNLFRYQSSNDHAVLFRSTLIKRHLPRLRAQISWVGENDIPQAAKLASWRIARPAIALATHVARTLNVSPTLIARRLRSFEAPHGRLEIVRKTKDMIFINDTTSTNPGAACYSLRRLYEQFHEKMPLTIIAGGDDKSLPEKEIKEYAMLLKKYRVHVLLLPGPMTDKLKRHLPPKTPIVHSFNEAVAWFLIHQGVLALIPGAASFNMFLNEFDRAEHFIRAVKKQRV